MIVFICNWLLLYLTTILQFNGISFLLSLYIVIWDKLPTIITTIQNNIIVTLNITILSHLGYRIIMNYHYDRIEYHWFFHDSWIWSWFIHDYRIVHGWTCFPWFFHHSFHPREARATSRGRSPAPVSAQGPLGEPSGWYPQTDVERRFLSWNFHEVAI